MNDFVIKENTNNFGANLRIISHFSKYNCISYHAGTLAFVTDRGTVEAYGKSYDNSIQDAKKWEDIISVFVGNYFILGLKNDGTLVGSGHLDKVQKCLGWHNIKSFVVNGNRVCGITKDETVALSGFSADIIEAAKSWKNVKYVNISNDAIIALKNDGTIFCCEFCSNYIYSYLDRYWRKGEYKEVWLSSKTVYALQDDGNVRKYSYIKDTGPCWISEEMSREWSQITHLYVTSANVFALKNDGSVIFTPDTSFITGSTNGVDCAYYKQHISLKNLVSIFCSLECFIGVTDKGNIIWSGYDINNNLIPDNNHMPNPDNIHYTFFTPYDIGPFDNIDTMLKYCENVNQNFYAKIEAKEQEIKKLNEEKAIQEEKRKQELELLRSKYRSSGVCQYCGNKFKGIFTKTCSVCGKMKDY